MPHLRTPSVSSSIHNLIRKSSIFGGSKGSMFEASEGAQCHASGAQQTTIALPSLGANQHVHMLPSVPAGVQMDASVVEWMARIGETRPEVIIASTPKSFHVNEAHLADIEPGSVALNPAGALLFLRILNTKLYSASEKSTYQVIVRVGDSHGSENGSLTAASCSSHAKTGDLFDWFLM